MKTKVDEVDRNIYDFKNKDDYLQAFQEVSKKTKCLIANGDDENIKRIKAWHS